MFRHEAELRLDRKQVRKGRLEKKKVVTSRNKG